MINDRFTAMESPRVGDFIRTAVLQQLETSFPTIVNVDVGPEQWTTDRVSLFVEPTDWREPGIDTTGLCPRGALTTLAKFGYRPIDGTYDAPLKGYDRDDPPVPRKVTFARGKILQEWTRRTLLNASLFDEPEQINRHCGILDLPWETLLPAMRAQILTYEDLYDRF